MTYDLSHFHNPHTVQPSVAGKNTIVTGGTTGIGRAIAALLVSSGAHVFIFGRHRDELNDAIRAMETGPGSIDGIVADQANGDHIEHVFEKAKERFQTLDILVNNAAVASGGILDEKDGDWRYELQSNLYGYLDCTRHAAEWMKEESGGGHIVNIGSVSAVKKKKGNSLYVAAKSAIQGYSQALREELAADGIKLSLIEPGLVGTDLFEGEDEGDPNVQRRLENEKKMMKAEDIAVAVHYCLTQPPRCNISLIRVQEMHTED